MAWKHGIRYIKRVRHNNIPVRGNSVEQVNPEGNSGWESAIIRQEKAIKRLHRTTGKDYRRDIMEKLNKSCIVCGKPAAYFAGKSGFCMKHKQGAWEEMRLWRSIHHPRG